MEGLYGFLHGSSSKYPDNVFVRCGNGAWTFRQVETMSLAISAYLTQCGIQKGDRVVIFCDNGIQYITAFFGIMRAGAIAVPVNPAKMADSLLYIIEKSAPGLILTCGSTADRLNGIREKLCGNVVSLEPCSRWEACGQAEGHASGPELDIEDGDTAMILFTSGTTAYPKGVTLSHGNLMANTRAIIEYLRLTPEDSVLMTLPFTYSYGNSVLLTHASAGAAIVVENAAAYPYRVLEAIEKYRVTGFSTVGSYAGLMLKCIKNSVLPGQFFNSLRYITFAGESTDNGDLLYINENYPGIEIFVMYGQTEACARLSYLSPELLRSKIGSVGRGLCNVALKVVNEEGCLVKPGEIGEIIASGPNIMQGYWKDPEATKEAVRNGWLYTGDLAAVDDDGFIYIKGRKTDMIKYMGHRISPVEIESILNRCPFVRESAVVECRVHSAPAIKAYVVLEAGGLTEELGRYAGSKLPPYMRPQVYEAVEQLPRTESGKIMRSALRSIKCAE